MAVHFTAMCLWGRISVVAALRDEEFSSVINQRSGGFTRGWVASPPGPFFFFFMGARIGCGSIWQQQQQRRLKSASHCVQVARHKVGGADNAGALMPPSGYAEKGSSGSFTRCVLSIRFFSPPDARNRQKSVWESHERHHRPAVCCLLLR